MDFEFPLFSFNRAGNKLNVHEIAEKSVVYILNSCQTPFINDSHFEGLCDLFPGPFLHWTFIGMAAVRYPIRFVTCKNSQDLHSHIIVL